RGGQAGVQPHGGPARHLGEGRRRRLRRSAPLQAGCARIEIAAISALASFCSNRANASDSNPLRLKIQGEYRENTGTRVWSAPLVSDTRPRNFGAVSCVLVGNEKARRPTTAGGGAP